MQLPRSLTAVSKYFDEDFDWDLVRRLSHAPAGQVVELAQRLVRQQWFPPDAPHLHRVAHEELVLPADLALPLSERKGVKELLLYYEVVLAADPITDWAHRTIVSIEVNHFRAKLARDELAQTCRGLLPLTEFLASGALELVPSQATIEDVRGFQNWRQYSKYEASLGYDDISLSADLQQWDYHGANGLAPEERLLLSDPVLFPYVLEELDELDAESFYYEPEPTAEEFIAELDQEGLLTDQLRRIIPRVLERTRLSRDDVARSILLERYLSETQIQGLLPW